MINHHHLVAAVISLLLCVLAATAASAESEKTIITAGPSWDRFTNEDGTGLYHDLIRHIFVDYTVKHLYVDSKQANSMVAIGRADIKMCETKEIEALVLSRYQMYENDFYALFLHERIGPWEGNAELKGRKLVWREGYYTQRDFPVPVDFTEVRSGEAALNMVVHGRADFYIDDRALITQSFDNAGLIFKPERFGLVVVGTRRYFPVFAKTPRGKVLLEHYEEAMERLYLDGTLKRIYKRWDFRMPSFPFSVAGK